MTAPLYLGHADYEKLSKCEGNQGLWFERFFDQYNDQQQWATPKPDTQANSTWLQGFKKAGKPDQLANHTQAQTRLINSLQGQDHLFKASGHFVTGMGNTHPVENGFAWHPTLGVPYLTGAAVKGLIRSYIENWLDDSQENKQALLLQWFGSIDKDPKINGGNMQAGELIFFDALPIQPVTLGVDIMTPHMGKWYEKGGSDKDVGKPDAVPADWHDPVPVVFLVAKEVTLLFSFALRQYPDADSKRPAIDLADVADVLNRALEQAGAGGKTATGYGGMQHDVEQEQKNVAALKNKMYEAEKKRLEQERQRALETELATLSPLAAEFKQQAFDGHWEQNKEAFVTPGVIEGWLDKLEEENDTSVVSMLVKLIETHLPSKLLDNPAATNKKGKSEFKPRQQQIGKRLNELRK